MELRRWPRKNDPESIRARQQALGLNGEVTAIDLAPFANAQEMLTGAAVIPVSVVAWRSFRLRIRNVQNAIRSTNGSNEKTASTACVSAPRAAGISCRA